MTADFLDEASEHEQNARDDAVATIRRRVAAEPRYHEACTFCGEPTPNGQRFCGKDCEQDADRIEVILKKQGRKA